MPKQKAIFTDIDNTLIKGTALHYFVWHLTQKKIVPLSLFPKVIYWYFQYKQNKINFQNIQDYVLKALQKSLTSNNILALQNEAKIVFNKTIKNKLYPEAQKMLKNFHEQGYLIFFVSSTIEPLALEIQKYFGFGEIEATKLEEKNGYYTGKALGEICHGEEKLKRVQKMVEKHDIDLKQSYVLADHLSDLPVLFSAGFPIVVNPNKKLKKVSLDQSWTIKNFKLKP